MQTDAVLDNPSYAVAAVVRDGHYFSFRFGYCELYIDHDKVAILSCRHVADTATGAHVILSS